MAAHDLITAGEIDVVPGAFNFIREIKKGNYMAAVGWTLFTLGEYTTALFMIARFMIGMRSVPVVGVIRYN